MRRAERRENAPTDRQRLTHRNHAHVDLCAACRYSTFAPDESFVCFSVDLYPEPFQSRAYPRANDGGVFTYPPAEGDGVQTPEHGCITTDVFAHAMAEHLERELGVPMALLLLSEELTHVVADARNPEQPGMTSDSQVYDAVWHVITRRMSERIGQPSLVICPKSVVL